MKAITIILIFLTTSLVYPVDWYHVKEQSDEKGGTSESTEGYNIVQCNVEETYCELVCIGGGPTPCTFDNCICTCDGFVASNSQDMFDYAHHQMDSSNFIGNYTNNIILLSGTKYYRTISWVQDSNGIRPLDYTLGVD